MCVFVCVHATFLYEDVYMVLEQGLQQEIISWLSKTHHACLRQQLKLCQATLQLYLHKKLKRIAFQAGASIELDRDFSITS